MSGSLLGGGGASSRRIHFVVVSSTDDWFWEYPEFFLGGLVSGKGLGEGGNTGDDDGGADN